MEATTQNTDVSEPGDVPKSCSRSDSLLQLWALRPRLLQRTIHTPSETVWRWKGEQQARSGRILRRCSCRCTGKKEQKEKRRNSATRKAKFSSVELQRQLLGFRKSLKEKKKKEQQQKKNENICLSVTKAHQCKPSQNQYTHLFADLNKEKLHIAINNL